MSVEEDIELKTLVAQTLENKGVLPKIRAELRANVFLALEENPNTKETLLKNDELSAFLKIPLGTLVLNLIREFLEFFELEFTLSVFEPETKCGKEYGSLTRDKIMSELKMADCNNRTPLLYEIIEKIALLNKSKDLNNGKKVSDLKQDSCNSGDNENLITSPIPLNTTYVKKDEIDLIPVSSIDKESKDNTIKEEVNSNNFSESDSLSEAQLYLDDSPKAEPSTNSPNNKPRDLKSNVSNVVPKESLEIDLLTFTPVKDTKSKEKTKNSQAVSTSETKTEDKKEKQKSLSALGDLPPLGVQSEEKGFTINDIKAIIDDWPGKNISKNKEEASLSSKSSKDLINDDRSSTNLKSEFSDNSQNKSQKSEATDPGDFEEDISELINGHTPVDTPHTIDETISKASCAADYLESL